MVGWISKTVSSFRFNTSGGLRLLLAATIVSGAALRSEAQSSSYSIPGYLFLPSHPALRYQSVRSEVEIVPEQEEKLRAISEKLQQEYRELYSGTSGKEMTLQERTELYRQASARYRELSDKAKAEVEDILLPHQIERLNFIELRTSSAWVFSSTTMLDRLGLTAQQKDKILENRRETEEKILRLNMDSFREILEVLTPEQIEMLKNPRSLYNPPANPPAEAPAK